MLNFLSTDDNSLARTARGRELEASLRKQGLACINSLTFWESGTCLAILLCCPLHAITALAAKSGQRIKTSTGPAQSLGVGAASVKTEKRTLISMISMFQTQVVSASATAPALSGNSQWPHRRCFTAAAACTCASTPQSYIRLLKTSTSKAFASSASEFVFLTVGCCLCLATHVQVCPGANDEAAAANAIRFKRNGPCEDFMISNLQMCGESVEGGGCRWTPKSAQGHN